MGKKRTGNPPGRPRGSPYKRGSILLPPAQWVAVARSAARAGISGLEWLRRAVDAYLRGETK